MKKDNVNTDIKELKQEVNDLQNFPVKLTWKQTWIAITVAVGIVGSIFGAGIKVQSEIMKTELTKQERTYQEQLGEKDEKVIELRRINKECMEENIFLVNRYTIVKDRFDKCLADKPLLMRSIDSALDTK